LARLDYFRHGSDFAGTTSEIASELKGGSAYLDLELPSDRAKLSDPEHFLGQHEESLVILDEIRYWQMLAHNQAQMLNAAQLASGIGVSGHTVAATSTSR
jgi:predicted AAA+ superfamily ATPase